MRRSLAAATCTLALVVGGGRAHAAAYTFQTIDSPRASYVTTLTGINDHGIIVGFDSRPNVRPNDEVSFVDTAGSFALSNSGGISTELYGINNNQQTIGNFYFATGNPHASNVLTNGITAFNFTNNISSATAVAPPLGSFTFPPNASGFFEPSRGINDERQIVGSVFGVPGSIQFLYDDSTGIATIFSLPNNQNQPITLTGINNAGQIVGRYGFDSYYSRGFNVDQSGMDGFVDSGGVVTTLTVPGAVTGTTAPQGISNAGEVVGYYDTSIDHGLPHGFIYDNGAYTTIDVPGATYTVAEGVNVEGDIVGYYRDPTGNHGFLATPVPVPEPGSVTLLGLGLAALGLVVRRGRRNA